MGESLLRGGGEAAIAEVARCGLLFFHKEYISLPPIRGAVRVRAAEIIPIEPDAGNADEGNINILLLYTPKTF